MHFHSRMDQQKTCIIILLLLLIDFSPKAINEIQCEELDSDSYLYSDEVYNQLAAEYQQYQDDLPMPAVVHKVDEAKLDESASKSIAKYLPPISAGINQEQLFRKELMNAAAQIDDISTEKVEESYAEMASRLKCDNPWFWNTPKCTWIDLKSKNVIERTKRNAKTAAWLLGSLFAIAFLCLCLPYCFYWYKMRNRKHLEKLRKKYTPGRIELPNGKVAKYQASAEEVEAYEDLIKALIVQELV